MSVELTVIYFAAVRDLVGVDNETITLEGDQASVESLVKHLERRYSTLTMEGVRIAVNEEFVDSNHPLREGDTIALIPPVSGG